MSESERHFEDADEAIRYWKKLAEERRADFEELQECSKDMEQYQEEEIVKLENENKRLHKDITDVKNQLENTRYIHAHSLQLVNYKILVKVKGRETEIEKMSYKIWSRG